MIEGWVESPFMRVSCHVLCLLKCWVTQITKKEKSGHGLFYRTYC